MTPAARAPSHPLRSSWRVGSEASGCQICTSCNDNITCFAPLQHALYVHVYVHFLNTYIYIFMYLCIYVSIYLFVYLFFHLFIYLSQLVSYISVCVCIVSLSLRVGILTHNFISAEFISQQKIYSHYNSLEIYIYK